jgi:hypothetical protein
MKGLASFPLMNICLIIFLLTAPAGAAISPCNQMTGSVSPDGLSVTLVVYDPKINGNWIYMYSMGTPITNFNISNGIARWCEGSGSPFNGYVVHVLFDPESGWRLDQSENFPSLDVNSLKEANGVVSVEGAYDVYYSTYDPLKGMWVGVKLYMGMPITPFLVNQDGIVAYFCGYPFDAVSCNIYDNTTYRGWKEKVVSATNFIIEQGCVKIGSGGNTIYWGYNPATGSWQEGATQSKAFIYANPTKGNPPLWVWFWDLSIGALAKQWNFGDGSPVVDGWSCGHNYPNKGIYTVSQFVVGYPGGFFDETTKTIYVGTGQGNPAVPLLLLD